MFKHGAFKCAAVLALAGSVGLSSAPAPKPGCLHGPSETPAQAARRQAALRLARELIATEAAAHQQAQSYYAFSDLPGLPRVPDGFQVQLSTDGASYTFSIKDTADACRFALFSDQDGVIYTALPIQQGK